MVETQRLEALLPASMLVISESPLPKGDYTIEATKGLFSTFRSGVHTLTRADKLEGYPHFYDDYCIAHYLLGLVAKQMAFFPEEVFDQDMCSLAVRSFKTVFRYAPYILDDTYAYYFSHYNLGLIMMQLGQLDDAEAKFKYLLSTINPTLLSLPALAAGKGRNSLEKQLQHQQEQEQRRHRKSPGSLASRTTSGGSEVYERGPTGSTAKLTRDFKDFPTIEVYR
ncbi:hypothetical protein BGZ97_006634 [Linnemannia gamsii]|uniref:Uncharacterized protein n=1 Tax=Linnemannia gamsii TaxID=64522 RepID=A0A9P6QT21_9FUNG|nr:hypothetical protein BGZ97_006634 [Linnemannia gamsii]